MKKLIAFIMVLWSSAAMAQSTQTFSNYIQNLGALTNPSLTDQLYVLHSGTSYSMTIQTLVNQFSGTIAAPAATGDFAYYSSANSIAGMTSLTHSGSTDTESGTINITGTFEAGGNAMTFPGSATTLAGLGVTNTFTAAQTINLNTATLPAPISGTLLQLGNANGTAARIELDSFATNDAISMRRADGTAASPTAVQANDTIANYVGLGYDGSAYGTGATIAINAAANNWTTGDHSAVMNFFVTPLGSTTLTNVLSLSGSGPTFALGTGGSVGAIFQSANTDNTSNLQIINTGTVGDTATFAQLAATLSSGGVYLGVEGGGSPTAFLTAQAAFTGGFTISNAGGPVNMSGTFNLARVSGGGAAAKYVCTDSSSNVVVQAGAC